MGFFTTPSSAKKRKRTESSGQTGKSVSTSGKKKRVEDEEISSEEEGEGRGRTIDDSDDVEEDEFADETAADKRRRLALQYLENTKAEIEEAGFNAEDVDRDILAERLKESVAEDKGRIYRHLTDIFSFSTASHSHFGNDTRTLTSIAVCHPYVYTVSKDRHLTKWQTPDPASPAKKPKQVLHVRCAARKTDKGYEGGHIDEILTIAASQDGKFVATGGKDNRIVVWNPVTLSPLKIFKQHRSPVMGLVFRRNTNQMYSCSADRTVKSWSLDELAYVETLFGHQDEVVGITALANERCVTVGARDRTARLWKIVDETQLVFRGSGESKKRKGSDGDYFTEGSMDCVTMIDEEHFVTGSDNGSISFWTINKKKPIFTVSVAHGKPDPLLPSQYSAESDFSTSAFPAPPPQPRPITALAAVPYSDTFFSGSYDGYVRVWRISSDKKRVEPVGRLGVPHEPAHSLEVAVARERTETAFLSKTITASSTPGQVNPPARGVVNGISVFETGEKRDVRGGMVAGDYLYVAVALGKEMRLGRWLKVPGKNGAVLFKVLRKEVEKPKAISSPPVHE
ncbi:WD40 repeat-like protein [Terfezia boudieri ATCC MYA-4762]|uniref:WD40 repeat-like protein n=1 Tax=Terfezia boudieri ATCC MYA-4762 TaxID=1051890 RepID=A0A3N4LWY0_9PEZI|nr:WD40 repeat-like protein [Terfezia boudieri ATCC MYA-4762]